MCEPGDTVCVLVTIPAHLSHTGKTICVTKPIDRCIADLVRALERGGIVMQASCCGHGKEDGQILLEDGRLLLIKRLVQVMP